MDFDQALMITTLVVVVIALVLICMLLWMSYKRRYADQETQRRTQLYSDD